MSSSPCTSIYLSIYLSIYQSTSIYLYIYLVVGGVEAEPVAGEEKDDELLPQWGIAVVVIGMASLAFVIIFGVSMVRSYKPWKKDGEAASL